MTATVAGGGIAGLTSAVALTQAGWQVTVLERAPAFGEVGAGLGLTGNAMAALDVIGAAEATRAAGHLVSHRGFQDWHGSWLVRMPADDKPEFAAVSRFLGIHRQRLHGVLLQAARDAGVELVTGAEVTGVQPGASDGEAAEVTWRSGTTAHRKLTQLVVAADGGRSAVRASLFPENRPRYSGSTSWRAVIPDTDSDGNLVSAWGPGTEFGALRISDSEIYWYGYFRHPEGASFDDELAAARDHFSGWSAQVQAIVAATTASQLMRHDVYHLPGGLPSYARGRVVLTGDAAHAMLPTIGQGAATALEDGVCVGRLIGAPAAAGGDLPAALAAFDRARRRRCVQITRQSALAGRFGPDLGGGWQQAVRNSLIRLMPARPLIRAGARMTRWTPPAVPQRTCGSRIEFMNAARRSAADAKRQPARPADLPSGPGDRRRVSQGELPDPLQPDLKGDPEFHPRQV